MSIKHTSLLAGVLFAAGVAGCGSDNYTAGVATTDPSSVYGAPTATAPLTTNVGLALTTTELGTILTDGKGNTLYLFTKDTPTTSACTGDCATNWPPFIGGATPSVEAGLDEADFGTLDWATSDQVTFHGHPLYYYAGDAAPGDTNGEGIGSNWYVIDANGNPIR